jgi:hypothetical protein
MEEQGLQVPGAGERESNEDEFCLTIKFCLLNEVAEALRPHNTAFGGANGTKATGTAQGNGHNAGAAFTLEGYVAVFH